MRQNSDLFTRARARATRSAVLLRSQSSAARERCFTGAAGTCLCALTLAGAYEYATILQPFYPIEQWLFWRLGMLWGWVAVLSLACTSFGRLVLTRALRLYSLPVLEEAVFSMAIGVVAFVIALYIGGALAWFTPLFAVLLPCAMIAVAYRQPLALYRRLALAARDSARRSPLSFLLVAAGVCCVGVLYLGAMTPDSLNYDSTWCHLTVAQDYARAGRIIAFPADYTKNMPQLASLIHTWGWLVPGLDIPALRWMLVLHNEFGLFLWTLVGVAAGVRRLLNDQRLVGTWASFFLFPIIYVYDNNMGGAADHVCAFFAVPMVLATLLVCRDFSLSSSILLGVVTAGALMTKYQAAYLVVGVALVLGCAWIARVLRLRQLSENEKRRLWWSPPLIIATTVLCACPHYIRQYVFHHNPFYPFLQNKIASTPTVPNAAMLFNNTISDYHWIPAGTPKERLLNAVRLFWMFSFEPHYSFTRNVPVFGSLFTLLLPALLFVRDRFRILVAAIIASVALFIWALVYNVDRNLQVFMPVMVCVTAALIIKIWRTSRVARIGLVPLVALQIVWGGDALFYNSWNRIDSALNLIRSGFDRTALVRFDGYRASFLAIRDRLPPNARVLLHNAHPNLGIDRELYLDGVGYQGLISYDALHTPAELYAYFRKLGITHLLYDPDGFRAPTKQQEALWNAFIRDAHALGRFGGYKLLEMPKQAPPPQPSWRVAAFGLAGYANGVYPITAMNTDEYLPAELQRYARPERPLPDDPEALAKLLEDVDVVYIGRHEHPPGRAGDLLREKFERNLRVDPFTLYLRK